MKISLRLEALALIATMGALTPMARAQWDLYSVSNTNTLMRINPNSGPNFTATPIGNHPRCEWPAA